MPTAYSTIRREQLREYEEGPRAKQKEFLERYEFKEVPIEDPSDIQVGDHLIRKGTGSTGICCYSHHMLCTETSHDEVKIIEYTGPYSGISTFLRSVASKDLTVFGKIVEKTYTSQELLKKKILKIIWPDELKCFSVEEVIQRARSRINETCYDMLKNNCEHFVNWSKSGLNVSQQVKSWYVWAREGLYSCLVAGYNLGKNYALPIIANVSDEATGALGFIVGVALEVVWAICEIRKAFYYHNKTSREFWAKLVDVIAKVVFRLVCGAFGSWLAGGLVASLTLGAIGAAVGHFIAAIIGWLYENYRYLDG